MSNFSGLAMSRMEMKKVKVDNVTLEAAAAPPLNALEKRSANRI